MRRLLLAVLLVLPAAARAQIVSVYGTFSPVSLTGVPNGTSPYPGNANYSTTSYWAQGYGGGVTIGVLPIGPIHLGIDMRGSTKPGAGGADTAMFGFRIAFKPPVIKIKPYIQASAAYVAPRPLLVSNGTTTTTVGHDEFLGYAVIGGVDYPIMRLLDVRIIEIGGGKAYDTSGFFSDNSTSISIFTINTGLVVHF